MMEQLLAEGYEIYKICVSGWFTKNWTAMLCPSGWREAEDDSSP